MLLTTTSQNPDINRYCNTEIEKIGVQSPRKKKTIINKTLIVTIFASVCFI